MAIVQMNTHREQDIPFLNQCHMLLVVPSQPLIQCAHFLSNVLYSQGINLRKELV